MRARDVMTIDVVTVRPDTRVVDAAKLLLDRHISGMPVVDGAGKLVGVVSEGDLMRRAELATGGRPWWADEASPEQRAKSYVKAHGMHVKDVMTKDVVTIDEHAPLDRIAMLFETHGIKRAPVLKEGKIVGIVSRANLLQGLASAEAGPTGPGDDEIRAAIMRSARDDAGVRAEQVDVIVANGVVHLWGCVASEAERNAIGVIAECAEGVRAMHNHVRVLPRSVVSLEPE